MAKQFLKSAIWVVLLPILLLISGCKINYSFTGASIPPEVKTISVEYFPNYAPLAQPTLSQEFTDALRNIFLSQTNLAMVEKNGDLRYEGEITGYKADPVAIQGNETAAFTRLTITVNVRFVNTKNEEQSFEKKFTQFEDFERSKGLSEVEGELIRQINEKLTQQIFNESVSNW